MEEAISTNVFPAKLWRLVNNLEIEAISWNSQGDLIVIDHQLFHSQVLSPKINRNDGFKTNNFSSFIRQLNLYGFKKVVRNQDTRDGGPYYYFHNPNFKRNHPELVANLRRLTVENKTKMEAGLEVSCRLTSQRQSTDRGRRTSLKRKSPPFQPTRLLALPPADRPHQSQALEPQSGTPVPPWYQVKGPAGEPLFAPVQCVPVFLRHRYPAAVQQGLLCLANVGNQPFIRFNPQNAQHQPPYYHSVCQHCYSRLVQPNIPSLQTEFFSPRFYQGMENQEVETTDINLDTVFQIADDVMQMFSSVQTVQTPVNPVSVLKSAPGTCKATPRDDKPSTAPSNATPMVMAVSNVPAYKDESVTSVSEQIPGDAIVMASTDQGQDDEIIVDEISDQVEAVSQK